MSELDPRTLIFVAGLLGLLCALILFMLRRSFPPTIGGLMYWSRGLLGMVFASGLFGMTDRIPPFFSVVLANAMLVAGIMSFYAGFLQFAGRPTRGRLLAGALALLTCYVAWFTYVEDYYPARALAVTATNTFLFFACARVISQTVGATLAGRFACTVFLGIGTVSALRVLMLLLQVETPVSVLGTSLSQKFYLAALAFSVLAITLGAMMMANERLRTALEFIASHDHLTGAHARSAFIDILDKELARGRRSGRMPALLMFDLDEFKSINDRFGHAVGDSVIIDFVRRTKALLRSPDSLGRYGGEEFVALLPETTMEEASAAAERICSRIASPPSRELPGYTVSIGVACPMDEAVDVDSLLAAADRALYVAKAKGRNRVELAQPEDSLLRQASLDLPSQG